LAMGAPSPTPPTSTAWWAQSMARSRTIARLVERWGAADLVHCFLARDGRLGAIRDQGRIDVAPKRAVHVQPCKECSGDDQRLYGSNPAGSDRDSPDWTACRQHRLVGPLVVVKACGPLRRQLDIRVGRDGDRFAFPMRFADCLRACLSHDDTAVTHCR
jgi:hypothetical protein